MCYRICPSCGARLGFLDIVGPAFKGMGKAVVCSACSTEISKPFRNLMWLPMLGFPLGYFVPSAIADQFGLGLLWEWAVLGVLVFFLLALMCVMFPLTIQGQEEILERSTKRNYLLSEDRVTAVLRPYSGLDKVLFGFSVVLFLLSAVTFRFIDWDLAWLLFVLSAAIFFVFLLKRIKIQISGELVTIMDCGADHLRITKLKNAPFMETEVEREIIIPTDSVKKICASVIGGIASDPSYSLTFVLQEGRIIDVVLPFNLGDQAIWMVNVLRRRLGGVEFEVDERFLQ